MAPFRNFVLTDILQIFRGRHDAVHELPQSHSDVAVLGMLQTLLIGRRAAEQESIYQIDAFLRRLAHNKSIDELFRRNEFEYDIAYGFPAAFEAIQNVLISALVRFTVQDFPEHAAGKSD